MKHKDKRKRTIRRNNLRSGRRNHARRSFSRKPGDFEGQKAIRIKPSAENKEAVKPGVKPDIVPVEQTGKRNRIIVQMVPKAEPKHKEIVQVVPLASLAAEQQIPPVDGNGGSSGGGDGRSRWHNPRFTGLLAAILLLATLVTAAWSSVSSAKADDEALEVRASAQTGSLQLAKEYIYAGSRMLAIEDYGLSGNSTSTPTPTPTATPTPNTPTPTPTPIPNNYSPVGTLESANGAAATIAGWSYDPDNPSVSNQVHLYINGPVGAGTFLGAVNADQPRPDVNSANGITGNHGFSFTIPSQYLDGQQHSVYAYGIDTGANNPSLLTNSPLYFQYPTSTPLPLPTAGSYYQVVSKLSSKCAEVSGGISAVNSGTPLQQWDCIGASAGNQLWQFVQIGDAYQVIAYHSGKCMDVSGVSTSDGAGVQQWDCLGSGQTNQLWKIVQVGDAFQLVAKHSDKCLDVAGGSGAVNNGDGLQQWGCFGASATNQLWTLVPVTPAPTCHPSQSEVRHCADQGGSWNYSTCQCDPSQDEEEEEHK